MKFKVDTNRCGALLGCQQYPSVRCGDNYWKACSIDELDNNNLTIMFVKYINIPRRADELRKMNLDLDSKRILNSHISGLLINNVIYFNDNYYSNGFLLDIDNNDEIYIKQYNCRISDVNLIGRFDIANSTYYVELTD